MRPLLEPAGFSQLVLVLDLYLRLLLPPAVSSNVAAFLQLFANSVLGRMVYTNFATTADWLTRCWSYFEQAGTNGTPT